jgi:hypothetical protein
MEVTSDYWKPVFYLLESRGLDPWLVNARDVKHLPGRPKTDRLDAVWLAKVAERQMLRPSFVPPRPIRLLRDLTRYRAGLVKARTAEKNRVEKPPALRRGHSVRAACAPRANACARSGHASRAQQQTVDPDTRRRGRRERGSCDPTSPPRPASVYPDAAAHPGRGVGDAASTTSLTRCRSLNRTA